jgi:hypothetical protein
MHVCRREKNDNQDNDSPGAEFASAAMAQTVTTVAHLRAMMRSAAGALLNLCSSNAANQVGDAEGEALAKVAIKSY